MITLEVLGTPAPKGSARAFVNKRTGRAFVAPGGAKSTEIKIASWNVAVRQAALVALEAKGLKTVAFANTALFVAIFFRMARPRGHFSKTTGALLPSSPVLPSTKPDIDKLARTTLDALTGSIFDDDSRIASLHLDKVWAEPGREGATITVQPKVPIETLIARSSIGCGLANIRKNGVDAELADIEDELAMARKVGEMFREAAKR